MRRSVLSLAVAVSLGLALVSAPASAVQSPAGTGLVTIGCVDTPVDLGNGATITRTCGSWDGTNAALWVEGTNLNQEFTAVGSATFNLFGWMLTVEAEAGIRTVEGGGWEAFVALTQPFAWGPFVVPLEVAPDGSKVTVWILSEHQSMRAQQAEQASAGSTLVVRFLDRDGVLRGTVSAPLGLAFGTTPAPPGPDLRPAGAGTGTGTGAPAPSTGTSPAAAPAPLPEAPAEEPARVSTPHVAPAHGQTRAPTSAVAGLAAPQSGRLQRY